MHWEKPTLYVFSSVFEHEKTNIIYTTNKNLLYFIILLKNIIKNQCSFYQK
ncbi:MAG: hypothetical protein TRG1_2380 [Flavobacteriaceae bacterium FS1-H7996/R]|nr:MAG: hypothetical protein TRG1_2380 [Flavobacteriaceae bacterium FS1-H7996/R]